MLLKRIAYFLPLALLFSCSTSKNTVVTRSFHNLTARFNGYYYSCENINEGVYKIKQNNKDNYDRVLPVYIYPGPDEAKATFPEFDKAIKKSSLCIQRHTIKNSKGKEIPSAGKWIDNNWINIGIAHFYKREFFSGIEAFEYVVRTYKNSDDKYTAMIWLIKTHNEIGAVSSSEPILALLKNERRLPLEIRNELPVAYADYYTRRGQYNEAIKRLTQATKNNHFFRGLSKERRARYSFIIGQLSELTGSPKKAIQYYQRTIKLKPRYELVFYSKIKTARLLDGGKNSSEKTKKDLLKMAREFKNSEYYDVIYYTLGEISEKEKNIDQAISYYQKSAQTSLLNPNQKALAYLKLGEIHFARSLYKPAGAYYDSAVATLPIDHPDFDAIVTRKKTLETLVGYLNTISREDSLQKIAAMPETERITFIDNLIAKYKEDQERLARELEAQMSAPMAGFSNTLAPNAPPGMAMPETSASFYFYNANTVALGIADFVRKWGNRKLEDHWRRSNKAIIMDEESVIAAETDSTGKKVVKEDPATTREFYIENLPLSDSLIAKSNSKLIYSYYHMGALYREELRDTKETEKAFRTLNSRFPDNKYELSSYYMLYRMYQETGDKQQAETYRQKILSEYPDSEFALLIKNPEYAEELNAQKSEVESFYQNVYEAYKTEDYGAAYASAHEGLKKYGKSDFADRFTFIRAMSTGKLRGIDTLEQNLKLMVAKYPKSELTPLAEDILKSINNQKNPTLPVEDQPSRVPNDTFTVNFDAEHFIFAILPDNTEMVDAFKTRVGNFNSIFYSEKNISITSSLFGKERQMVLLKSFPNASEAVSYYENLIADKDVFSANVKLDLVEIYPIMPSNLPFVHQRKSAEGYKLFYADQYKKISETN